MAGAGWPGQSTAMLSGCPLSLQLTPLATPAASLGLAGLGHIDCLVAATQMDCSIVFVQCITKYRFEVYIKSSRN